MLGQLARQNESDSSLDFSGCDSWLLVVASQRRSLHCNFLEDVGNERVQDGHGLGRDSGVGMDLLQDLQHKCEARVRKLATLMTVTNSERRADELCDALPCRCRSCSFPQPSWSPFSCHQWISLQRPSWQAGRVSSPQTWVPCLLLLAKVVKEAVSERKSNAK